METRQAIAALGALAQETRLSLYRLLVQTGPQGLAAGIIAQKLEVPNATLSFHLAQLVHADLILQRRESRSLIYAANFANMNSLVAFLTENCCGATAACNPNCEPAPRIAKQGADRHETPARARRR